MGMVTLPRLDRSFVWRPEGQKLQHQRHGPLGVLKTTSSLEHAVTAYQAGTSVSRRTFASPTCVRVSGDGAVRLGDDGLQHGEVDLVEIGDV
jgi:hypothetical protein